MTWKPIKDYPIQPSSNGAYGPVVLARTADKAPLLVRMADGHFYICPGVPLFYGKSQFGMMTADHIVEFMDIPT